MGDFADPSRRTSPTLLACVQIKAEAYGKFADEATRPELERFFYLDDVDRKLIAKRRGYGGDVVGTMFTQ
ncbi:DUF4158 domain-containing protein [Streptomyces sp. NBC_01619]|uniref:hypothetical protein n=1 Tax=Streptomyces sp. NBC_01619 TaxID=2975901 RepID=UPI00225B47DC|nr:hypothetical protein [Streptomyces sp. NBC_01619]MCX4515851.1 DUF4158 domain-containing protein [Streptomyces sp. NBC_01619]